MVLVVTDFTLVCRLFLVVGIFNLHSIDLPGVEASPSGGSVVNLVEKPFVSQAAPGNAPSFLTVELTQTVAISSTRALFTIAHDPATKEAPASSKTKLHHLRGQSPLANVYNSLYTGTIFLGSPPVETQLIFDTGSANLWTLDSVADHSTSLVRSQTAFGIEYGSGSVAGKVATDDILVGQIPVRGVTVGVVNPADMTVDFQESATGILGLAFRSISVQRLPTVLDDLFAQHPQMPKIFSFFLTRNPGESGSRVMFGDIAHDVHSNEPLAYAPVESATYWTIGLAEFGVRGVNALSSTGSHTALVDSGTSFIGVPEKLYSTLINAIAVNHTCSPSDFDGHAYLVCDCTGNGLESFPPLTVRVKGKDNTVINLDLQPEDYIQIYPSVFHTFCIPLVLPIPPDKFSSAGDVVVLGMPLLRAFYTVFDFEGAPAVGFARSAAPPAQPAWKRSAARRLVFVVLCVAQLLLLFKICRMHCGIPRKVVSLDDAPSTTESDVQVTEAMS